MAPSPPLRAAVVARAGSLLVEAALEVVPGEPLGVLGRTAAGKTTLLRCLCGLLRPESGRIALGGLVWFDAEAGIDVPAHRRRAGLVPQHGGLFPHLDVAGNVAYGLRAAGLDRGTVRRRLGEALERLELAAIASRRPERLSGGERQRVALARALVIEPTVLLLDEPLAALDAVSRDVVRDLLRSVVRDPARVTVLVTHDAHDAIDLTAQLLVLDAGRVVQHGSAVELAQRPASSLVAALTGGNRLAGIVVARSGDVWTVQSGALRLVAVAHPDRAPRMHGRAWVIVAPSDITLHAERPSGSAQNVVRAVVSSVTENHDRVRVTLAGDPTLIAEITRDSTARLGVAPGGVLWASFKATAATVVA